MRFQAELPSQDTQVLQTMMKHLEVTTNAELLSHLLYIAKWAIDERAHGRRIASLGEQGNPVKELVSPLLERAAPEHDLPTVQIDWTAEELEALSSLTRKIAPPPNEKLRKLMKGGVK